MRPMQVDFIDTTKAPMLGWLVLLLALVTGGVMTHQIWLTHQQELALTQAQEATAHRQAELERQRLAALPPATPPYVDDRRWQRAAFELTLPWLSTLRALEQATKPPVFLVGFKSDPANGRLQLDAEAPDLDAALAYTASLQADTRLTHTQLSAHDQAGDPQGHGLVKFSLQTQWVKGQVDQTDRAIAQSDQKPQGGRAR